MHGIQRFCLTCGTLRASSASQFAPMALEVILRNAATTVEAGGKETNEPVLAVAA